MDKSNPLLWGFCQGECEDVTNSGRSAAKPYKSHVIPVIIITTILVIFGLSRMISVHSSGISGAITVVGYSINNGISTLEFFPVPIIASAVFLLFAYLTVSDIVLGLDR